jgi:hypothetical protein
MPAAAYEFELKVDTYGNLSGPVQKQHIAMIENQAGRS